MHLRADMLVRPYGLVVIINSWRKAVAILQTQYFFNSPVVSATVNSPPTHVGMFSL